MTMGDVDGAWSLGRYDREKVVGGDTACSGACGSIVGVW
jgi:hypothetical protein